MSYEELIELLCESCKEGIPVNRLSLLRTLENSEDICVTYPENNKQLNNKQMYSIYEGQELINNHNVLRFDLNKVKNKCINNTIVYNMIDDYTMKILCVSDRICSPITIARRAG